MAFFLIQFSTLLLAQEKDTIFHQNGTIFQIIEKFPDKVRTTTYGYGGSKKSEVEYSDSLKNGVYLEYYADGSTKIKATYQDDMLVGSYIEYSTQGEIIKNLHYEIINNNGNLRSVLDGKAEYFNRNGMLIAKGKYKEGVKNGIWYDYDASGRLSHKFTYKNGEKAGIQESYYPNGHLRLKSEIYEDIVVDGVSYPTLEKGTRLSYYDNGVKQSEIEFEKGKPTGESKRWNNTGHLSSVSKMINDSIKKTEYFGINENTSLIVHEVRRIENGYVKFHKQGKTIHYYENGEIKSEENYVNDKLEGSFVKYHPNGKIWERGKRKNGNIIGLFESYYENGQLKTSYATTEIETNSGYSRIITKGWSKKYDENGEIKNLEFYNDEGKKLYLTYVNESSQMRSIVYEMGNIQWIQSFYPNNILYSDRFSATHYNRTEWYYVNGQPFRFIIDPYDYKKENMQVTLNFKGELEYSSLKNNNLSPKNYLSDLDASKYSDGSLPKDGEFKILHLNGNPRVIYSLKDYLFHGSFKRLLPTGKLIYEAYFKDKGELDWSYSISEKGDTMQVIKTLKNGNHYQMRVDSDNSLHRTISDSSGEYLYKYETYEDRQAKLLYDRSKGISKNWYKNGKLSSIDSIITYDSVNKKNQKIIRKYFYENRQLKNVSTKVDGNYEGNYLSYFENGQLETSSEYENNLQNGMYIRYADNGDLIMKGTLVDGKKEGKWKIRQEDKLETEYYQNNQLQLKAPSRLCECQDTTNPVGKMYSNTLANFFDYNDYLQLNFSFLNPIDSISYHKLFCRTNGSLGQYNGYLTLVLFQPLRINFKGEKSGSFVLNNCFTKGYLSKVNFGYVMRNDPDNRFLSFRKIDLEFEFYNPFFKQLTHDLKVSLKTETLEISEKEHLNLAETFTDFCFEPIARAGWQLNSAKGRLIASLDFERINYYTELSNMLNIDSLMLDSLNHLNELVGITVTDGSGTLKNGNNDFKFESKILILSNELNAGSFTINYKNKKDGNFGIINQNGDEKFIPLSDINNTLSESGFSNVKTEVLTAQKKIKFSFVSLK